MLVRLLSALVLALLVSGCGAAPREVASAIHEVEPPPAHARWDYQIGGVRSVPDDVGVVTRDRKAKPAGDYAVCYVNAFQTQPDEASFWRAKSRWGLVLKDAEGRAVVDGAWGEWLLDTRTAAKRKALAAVVGRWTDGCARAGYDAVEYDNLDSFARSKKLITPAQNKAFAALIIARAHDAGLAVGQKNWPELGKAGPALGFDFAVAEECGQYDECDAYTAAYGSHVLAVEYTDAGFRRACAAVGDRVSVVRCDRDVTASGVRRWC